MDCLEEAPSLIPSIDALKVSSRSHMDSLRIGHLMSREFVEALDELYPARPPDPRDSEREVWMKAGERRLAEVLMVKFDQAQQEGLPHV